MAERLDIPCAEVSRREFCATGVAVGAALTLPAIPGVSMAAEAGGAPASSAADATLEVALLVNGKDHALKLDPRATLLDTLRETLGLTGSKKGCDHGQCGACTVLVNDKRVLSCLTLAAQVEGDDIKTIEGIATGEVLHPVQAAFIKHDAFQCGYCTPGQICSAVGLLHEGRCKTEAEIREQMSGNLCRCGAYGNIVAAISEAMGKPAGVRNW